MEASFTAWKLFQVFCSNVVRYNVYLMLDLSSDKQLEKSLEKILVHTMKHIFVENAEVSENGALNITPAVQNDTLETQDRQTHTYED